MTASNKQTGVITGQQPVFTFTLQVFTSVSFVWCYLLLSDTEAALSVLVVSCLYCCVNCFKFA